MLVSLLGRDVILSLLILDLNFDLSPLVAHGIIFVLMSLRDGL